MATPGPANMIARHVTDDLIAFSGETTPQGEQSKLEVLNHVIDEALEDIDTQETNVEMLDDENDGVVQISINCNTLMLCHLLRLRSKFLLSRFVSTGTDSCANLGYVHTDVNSGKRFSCGELVDSSRPQYKMKVVFVQAHCADESFIALMLDLCSALRVSITKNQRLIAELEAFEQRGKALKPLDYMKEMVGRDSAVLGVLE
uniref:Uncharacterized protein n=1 Tax=Tanacetum cinerariifolium TaxID=118510 RepID=A0A6L2K395_TANCI|nr:hypothetical protein [Tanacetum cinerariifolium]